MQRKNNGRKYSGSLHFLMLLQELGPQSILYPSSTMAELVINGPPAEKRKILFWTTSESG